MRSSGPQSKVQRRRRPVVLLLVVPAAALLLQSLRGSALAALCEDAFVTPALGSCSARGLSRTACAAKKKKKDSGGGGGDAGRSSGDQAAPAVEIDTEALMNEWEDKIVKAVDVLKESLVGIRAGKASPAMLADIKVSAYESEVGVNEVATITTQDQRTLLLTAFDAEVAPNIAKAIIASNMGYAVNEDGANVKVTIPELTTDKRTQYVKLAKDSTEKSRVAVRNVRQAALKKVKGLSKKMSEDITRSLEKEIEAMVKKNIKSCDDIFKKKEQELLKA